ncbi:dehydrogenase/reductase SDR family member on chromosome X-like isoform X2 [Triplophysa dalaica]|uniref:dehydrogenase/reductase SDR family member on chromosome X-like isoform X2 n=1 Tax=Triplophysa dalaica TaxID=1582913 RepID=UPI0024E02B88|nr:dehydrogenase/reductase SDR family member on chromosome X-like isoform X2 [Triplophysa dalaica]
MWIVSRVIPVLKLYFTGLKVLLYQLWNTRFLLPVLANQNGRVAIVTGGARGLGYETVRQLVNLGMFVIIASRNEEEALCAVKKISEENSEAQAGVMLLPEGRTADGFETHFATNYLGHFLLTRLLLETLVHSGKDESYSRILNVSSSAHHAADLRLHDLQNVRCHSAHEAYSGSKLAQVMFTYHLCEELESSGAPVTVNAVDPGVVNTGLYSHLCCLTRYAHKLIAHFLFKTPADGAATAVYSALSPHLERVSGCYLHEGRCVESSSNSYDKDLQTRLWQNTCDLLNLQHSLELHAHITPELK